MLTIFLYALGWYVIGLLIAFSVLYYDYKRGYITVCDCWFFLFSSAVLGPFLLLCIIYEWLRRIK